MASAEKISVEVAYALPEHQIIIALTVAADATVQQVIEASGLLDQYPEIDLTRNKVGVFGKLGKLNDTLHPGDRVEIYRPLIADPKEIRRQRAAAGKAMKKGGGNAGET